MGKAGANPRGPAPTPTRLKVLRGTDRADRKAPNEMKPKTASLLPKPPDYFDDVAKKIWQKVTRNLRDLKMLCEVDYELLSAYCFQLSIIERTAKELAKPSGLLIKFKNKAGATNLIPHPHVKIYNDALSQANRLAAQFGFSPSSRTRISAPSDDKPSDPWNEV